MKAEILTFRSKQKFGRKSWFYGVFDNDEVLKIFWKRWKIFQKFFQNFILLKNIEKSTFSTKFLFAPKEQDLSFILMYSTISGT